MTWKTTLNAVLKAHNKVAATGGRTVGFATQAARREILEQGFRELRALGYKLRDVRGFKERHMTALGYAWEAKGLAAATIQNRISIFRIFAEWIGKRGMIRDAECYVKNPNSVARPVLTTTDKTRSDQQQALIAKLPQVQQRDRFVALQLELQRAFGLGMKEAALLKPHLADKGLTVGGDAKGRWVRRVVPIQTAYQQDVLARAKALLANLNGSMIPRTYNLKQWRNHYYHVCRKVGISRKAGITSHSLRQPERLNETYQAVAVQANPTEGSLETSVAKQLDLAAHQEVAEVLNHNLPAISDVCLDSAK